MELAIEREDTPRGGRYVARLEGGEAELTFTRLRPGMISADHTFVPESMGGKGVGRALIDAVLADARAQGLRIEPRCRYVRGQYARHPQWADLFTTPPGEAPPGAD